MTSAPPFRGMHHDPRERVIRRYFHEAWNEGRLEVLDELLTADYRNHSPSTADPPPGPGGLKPIVAAMRRAFPDLRYQIREILVGGADLVAVRVEVTGTHRGDFFGMSPTGRSFRVAQVNLERFREGRIAEHWRVTDEASLVRQLGGAIASPALPGPQPARSS